MTFDLSVSLGNVVTIVTVTGFFFNLKFNQDKMLPVIFSKDTGEVRLMSFDAHKELQKDCKCALEKDAKHISDQMARIEEMFRLMTVKMTEMSDCLTALKYGADGMDSDKC